MSRADSWMPLYVADYLRDTMRLTTEQHGAYFLLLLECWNGAGVLPADDGELAAIVRLPLPAWRKIRPTLARYFTVTAAEWSHKRVREEHEKAARLSAVKAENGRKGGRPPKQTDSSEKPTAILEPKLHKTPALVARPSPSPPPPEVSEVAIAPSGAAGATPQQRAGLALLAETLEAKGIGPKPMHDGDDRDPDAEAWSLAVSLLTKRAQLSDRQARTFFAGLLKRHSLRASEIYVALAHAEDSGTPDLQPYLTAAAQTAQRLRNDRPGPHPSRTASPTRAEARDAVWSQLAAEEDGARVGGFS